MRTLFGLLEESAWMVNLSLPIVKTLVSVALSPPPRVKSNGASKPVMLESNHPYDHNKDDYIPVRIKGSKKLIVTFDEQTATENGCDFIRFFKDNQRNEFWGENQYTGGKDGSTANWPGTRGRPPLIIPADHFVLYFHTDGSVNAWGWRVWVSGDVGSADVESLDPGLLLHHIQCYTQLLSDGPASQPQPENLDTFEVDEEQTKATVSASSSVVLSDLGELASNLSTITDPNKLFPEGAPSRPPPQTLPRSFVVNARDTNELQVRDAPKPDSPEVFTVPAGVTVQALDEKGDWLQVAYSRADDSTGPKTGWALRRSADSLYLIPDPPRSSSISSKSTTASALAGGEELITLPDEENIAEDSSRHAKHPMYSVEESNSQVASGQTTGMAHAAPQQVLNGCVERVERNAANLMEMGAIGLAQDCLSRIISKWPDDQTFSTAHFGGNADLVNYIRALFTKEASLTSMSTVDFVSKSVTLNTLKARLLAVIRSESQISHDLCQLLLKFALKQLVDGLKIETLLPPTRAVVRVVESKHPYDDNMDQSWPITIPNAKWMKLVFDKRSSTEKDCDYCVVYKNANKTETWGPRFTGRANSADKVWAGVGSTPYCRVGADSCVVHFHSDGSNTDWGFKLTVYGIMEEASEEEKEKQESLKGSSSVGNTELACWILDFLASEHNAVVIQQLYAPSTLQILGKYMEIMRGNKKCFVVNLLANMLQELPKMPVSESTLREVRVLEKLIISQCVSQHKEEAAAIASSSNSSSGATDVSPLFQALIQAAVIATCSVVSPRGSELPSSSMKSVSEKPLQQLVVGQSDVPPLGLTPEQPSKDKASSNPLLSNGNPVLNGDDANATLDQSPLLWSKDCLSPRIKFGTDESIILKTNEISFDYSTAVCSTQEYRQGCKSVNVKVLVCKLVSSSPIIGMTTGSGDHGSSFLLDKHLGSSEDCRSFGWGGRHFYWNGMNPKPAGPNIAPGDVICVEIDFNAGTVAYFRNEAFVFLAVGPAGSGAVVEAELGRGPFYPAVSVLHAGDSVQLVDSALSSAATESAVQPTKKGSTSAFGEMPDWFATVQETVTLLRSCAHRELPASLLHDEFLPYCQEKAKVVVESSHPFDNTPLYRVLQVPGAESLTLHFHESCRMGPDDVIKVTGRSPLSSSNSTSASATHQAFEKQCVEMKGMDRGTDLAARVDGIAVGDKVVRGPGWDWGDQDGGAGNFGEVIQVRAWKGKANTGALVRWKANNFEGLYRWDFDGHRDLIIVGQWDSSRKPITIVGEEVAIEVIPKNTKEVTRDPQAPQGGGWTGAVAFNGSNSCIRLDYRPELELDSDCTVEAWVRVATENSLGGRPAAAVVYPIVSRNIEIDGKMSQFSLQLGYPMEVGTTVLVLHFVNQSLQTALHIKGGTIPAGVWTHVATTIQAKMATLYVNGVTVASGSVSGTRMQALEAPLFVGGDWGQFFSGCLYDVRIWNTAHSSSQINAHKNQLTASDPRVGLVCHILLDSPPTDYATDSSPGRENCPLHSTDLSFNASVEPPVIATGTTYGYKCTIKPNFSLKTALSQDSFRYDLEAMKQKYTVGSLKHDLALVRYINQVSKAKNIQASTLLRCKWSEISPTEEELMRNPILKEIVQMEAPPHLEVTSEVSPVAQAAAVSEGVQETKEESPVETDQASQSQTKDAATTAPSGTGSTSVAPTKMPRPVEARFSILQKLNQNLMHTLSYVDMCMTERPWSIAYLLSQCRGLIFECAKMPTWEFAMQETCSPNGGQFELKLSRSRAAKHIRSGLPDHDARFMMFSQAFRQMHTMPPASLRRADKLYTTVLMGERAQDAGGPYRESFAIYALELQSMALPLMVRTPNGRHSVGKNREKWILNPGATSSTHMEMFAFMGKLMGISIRTKEYLALNIPPIVWKLLVRETPTLDDIEAIDLFTLQSLDAIRHIDQQGIDAESFEASFFETFTTMSTDERVVPLKPGGEDIGVTFASRHEFCDLVERYRLHEFDLQAEAVRKGLATMIPARLLSLFSWDQLEMMVCGVPEVDIKLLMKVTDYSSCSANDEHVKFFWQAMEEFSTEERSMFLRFTWGRSRLPLSADGFSQRFKLQSFTKTPPDNYFPVAHTCFFSLELPRYSSYDIMKDKLRYAIYNCQAIDGDDTSLGMQAAAMGWEE